MGFSELDFFLATAVVALAALFLLRRFMLPSAPACAPKSAEPVVLLGKSLQKGLYSAKLKRSEIDQVR